MERRRCSQKRVQRSLFFYATNGSSVFTLFFSDLPRDKESISLYIFNLLLVCIMRVKSEEASN